MELYTRKATGTLTNWFYEWKKEIARCLTLDMRPFSQVEVKKRKRKTVPELKQSTASLLFLIIKMRHKSIV